MKKTKRTQIKLVIVSICIFLFAGSSVAILTRTSPLEELKDDHVVPSRIEHVDEMTEKVGMAKTPVIDNTFDRTDKSVGDLTPGGLIRHAINLAHAAVEKKVTEALAQRIDGTRY